MSDLSTLVRLEGRRARELSELAGAANGRVEELVEWREQLTHDARNACAGVRATIGILDRYDDRLQADAGSRLRLAAIEGLAQIEHLVTRSASQPTEEFDATAVATAVAESARAQGCHVVLVGRATRALGRPGDLAIVLTNLLANARAHAPGSRVTLRVQSDGAHVRVSCSDQGPGIPVADVARVFDRGFCRPGSPGSGLGLHGARTLMREQGGDLVALVPTMVGATFVATLPAAAALTPLQPRVPPQGRDWPLPQRFPTGVAS